MPCGRHGGPIFSLLHLANPLYKSDLTILGTDDTTHVGHASIAHVSSNARSGFWSRRFCPARRVTRARVIRWPAWSRTSR
jgi:hypothetical protein